MAQVFYFVLIFFKNLDVVNSSYWIAFAMVFLMIFIFFESLKLTYIISKSGVLDRLIFVSISMLLISFVFIILGLLVAL